MTGRVILYLFAILLYAAPLFARSANAADSFAGLVDSERSAILKMVLDTEPARSGLRGSRYRVFGIQATGVKTADGLRRYAYTLIYDYSHNKTYQAINDVTSGAPGKIVEIKNPSVQPPPSSEEYAEAKQLTGNLHRVKRLLSRPNVVLQESFPIDSPEPCDISRCVEIQVNEIIPGAKLHFLLLVTVDLSARQVVDVRDPKTQTSIR